MTPFRRARFAMVIAAIALAACNGDSTGPALEITTETLPEGREDQPYSAAVDATGGPSGEYTWRVAVGALPAGLAFSTEDLSADEDLLITGTPTRDGTFTFTLEVTDGGRKATHEYTIVIGPPLVHIDNLLLPPALEGWPYDVPLRASGGLEAHAWSLTGGSLPAGLTLTEDGRIQGTPTETDTVEITVQVTSGDETHAATYELSVIADRPGFQITPIMVAEAPASIAVYVQEAIAMWEAALTGDLEATGIPADFFGSSGCAGFGQHTNGTTAEDVLVIVNIDSIDGPGQVLGQAGPCAIRDGAGPALTAVGVLTLDALDLAPMGSAAFHVIAHEIGHVLGFGGLWDHLIEDEGSLTPTFFGANGIREWHDLGGEGNVPVEGTGGAGTAGSHWRESVFGNELMTGFLGSGDNPLSRVTIGAFEDLGYEVDYATADPYSLPSNLLAIPGAGDGIIGWDVLLQERPIPIRSGRGPINNPQRD